MLAIAMRDKGSQPGADQPVDALGWTLTAPDTDRTLLMLADNDSTATDPPPSANQETAISGDS